MSTRESTIVMKFGGTSVADADAIRRLIGIVRAARQAGGLPPVLVVSAMSGVTDRLLALAAQSSSGDREAAGRGMEDLRARHLAALADLVGPTAQAAAEIDVQFQELQTLLAAVAILREATARSLDDIAATGELLSSRIVAGALDAAGVPAAWVDARRIIVTNDGFGAAVPLAGETAAAVAREIEPHLTAGRVPVLGGFVGSTLEGTTTTLGRGGSDYSASIVGAALGRSQSDSGAGLACREIQIWTDVDGMLTADPRIVTGTRVVPELSFGEASELAYFGAKVLHPSTILPAVDRDIAVRIVNSRRPDGPGTLITARPAAPSRAIAALACKRHVTVIEVTSTRMLMAHGFLRRLFEVFERHRTAVDVVTTSEVSVSVTVDDARRLEAIVAELREFAQVSVEPGMALLCAVGDALRADARLAIRVLGTLEGFPLRMVSQAASRRNLTCVVHERDLAAAMTRLHEVWFAEVPLTR